jgi:hypothetical protein
LFVQIIAHFHKSAAGVGNPAETPSLMKIHNSLSKSGRKKVVLESLFII